ncbi:sensor histidine kinase [Thalassorhabdomicrobium marinisediminis]|uniref:sensor histidine kinase n=1 Tax=Thalassorhabdomicrobium marinisediminis TaxID=2170577 RepID=UPI0024929556|nr:HAMP domain-containing sensor histidine kinase [Thalassorhabdomicrobium marinisediminis]
MRTALNLRLFLAAVIATAVALVATAVVLNFLFRLYFEDRLRDELETYLIQLSGNVAVTDSGEVEVGPLADPRFNNPLSGYYWQIEVTGADPVLSPSFWGAPMALERPEQPGVIRVQDINIGTEEPLAVAHWVILTGQDAAQRSLHLAVALDRTDLDVSVAGFRLNSTLWLAVLGAFLLIASAVQIRLGLRPLEKVRSEVNRVSRSPAGRLSDDYPTEVLPLVEEVNQLLDTNAATLERVRAGAGNLAHGLKTPLTILHGVERKLRKAGQDLLADELQTEIASIEHIVERELARHRDSGQSRQVCEVAPVVKRLSDALSQQPGAEQIRWTVEVDERLRAPFDEFDLTELVGNLLDNAMKWTDGRIVVRGALSGTVASLTVCDDGPGLSDAGHEIVLGRGRKADPERSGTGLGLSIADEMAQAHGCALTLDRSDMGGLSVMLEWEQTEAAPR